MSAESIKQILPGILRQAATQRQQTEAVQRCWKRLVGKALAAHARPAALRRGKLYIQIDEPGTGFLLSLEQAQLLKQLRAHTGLRIEELIVRVGEL